MTRDIGRAGVENSVHIYRVPGLRAIMAFPSSRDRRHLYDMAGYDCLGSQPLGLYKLYSEWPLIDAILKRHVFGRTFYMVKESPANPLKCTRQPIVNQIDEDTDDHGCFSHRSPEPRRCSSKLGTQIYVPLLRKVETPVAYRCICEGFTTRWPFLPKLASFGSIHGTRTWTGMYLEARLP